MASSRERSTLRNPLKEDDTDMDKLLKLGPVQPEGGPFKGTMIILVGDRLKKPWSFRKDGSEADHGWSTVLMKTPLVVFTAACSNQK